MSATARVLRLTSPLLALLSAVGCAPPAVDAEARTRLQLARTGDEAAAATAQFVDAIDSAELELAVALPALVEVDLADAIIRAQDRGVAIEVITDVDRAEDPGVALLAAAEVPLKLADPGIAYQDFAVNLELVFPGEAVQMSHAYAIVDRTRVLSAPFVGGGDVGENLVLDVESEDIAWDFLLEHGQIFGGLDASSLTAYSAGAKSIVDPNWLYPTQSSLTVELWFGPQERLIKRVIDAVYASKADVSILTDDMFDKGLATALQAKAADGFPMQVIVGQRFGSQSPQLSSELRDAAPDVSKFILSDERRVPTVVLIDQGTDPVGGKPRTRAFVLTHELVSATRTLGIEPLRSDQLIDGHLWVLGQTGEVGPEITQLQELIDEHLDLSEAL